VRLGSAIKELITIVHPRTFARWVSQATSPAKARQRGRPRKPEEIRQLIIQMAKDTGWGYKRILGELKKLRIHNVSRSTIARILKENGFDPVQNRVDGSWHDFVRRHIKTLWATDFFTKTVWTIRGPVTYYVLFFIHIHTRRVHIAGVTPNPDGVWMAQRARNMRMIFDDEPADHRPTHIVRDRDSKFTAHFCSILEDDGIEFKVIAPMSPNMNPFAEAWVQRTKQEVLDNFIVFGEAHLRFLLREWLTYYHEFRPHQGLGNVPISEIVCHDRLGGLLKHYERKAA
jgi:putative transposase